MEVPLKIISRTTTTFLLIISASVSMQFLTTTEHLQHIAERVLLIAACWQVGIWVSTGAMAWLEHKREFKLQQDRAAAGSISIIAIILRVVIWVVVLLLTLDNLGINITTLVAGLGIGGIAVALAIQNVLGDLLASLSITLDKPFIVGDSLVIDDINGTVEQIGLKTTRLRSVNGEQIIIANADLLKSRVRNFGRMQERRVLFVLNVAYDTPHEKLEAIAETIRVLVSNNTGVRFERCHLARLTTTAIEFEIVYFVLTSDYQRCMDIQQAVNLGIVEYFERAGIEFAQNAPQLLLVSNQV
jgi:small-conductance mechanosensitive channel